MKTKKPLIFLLCLLACLGFCFFLFIRHQQRPLQLTPIAEFNHGSWIRHVTFSPADPDIVASIGGGIPTSTDTNPASRYVAKVWNRNDKNKPKALYPLPLTKDGSLGTVDFITFSRTGGLFIIKSFGKLELWDVSSGKKINSFELPSTTAAFSPSQYHLATASRDVKLWDIRNIRDRDEITGIVVLPSKIGQQSLTHNEARSTHYHNETINQNYRMIDFSHNGKWIAASGHISEPQKVGRDRIKIWDLQHKELFKTLPIDPPTDLKLAPNTHYFDIKSIEFSQDNRFFAVAGKFGYTIWTLPNWHVYYEVRDQNIKDIAFSPDGKMFVVVSDATILWSVENLTPIAQLKIPEGFLTGTSVVGFSQDSSTLASGSMDGILRLWDVEKLKMNYSGTHN